MGLFTVFTAISLLGTALVYGACPANWREYSGSCYMFQREIENWVDARMADLQVAKQMGMAKQDVVDVVSTKMCKWHGADLIVIETQAEQDWFRKQALTFNHTNQGDGFWLGATDWTEEGKWVWESANSVPATFLPWGAGQPNNRNGSENCLAAIKYFDYSWTDLYCNWVHQQYVCEMPEGGPALSLVG